VDGHLEVWGVSSPGREAIVGAELSAWADQKYVHGMSHLSRMLDVARLWDAGRHTWLDLNLSEDRYTTSAYLRVEQPPPLDDMALLLGDGLHCLRGALDSLTWELCHLDGPPDPAVLRRIQFPCARTDAEWLAQVTGPLASMPVDFQQRIYGYQPMHFGTDKSAIALLFELNNQDKHRGAIQANADLGSLTLPVNTEGQSGTRRGIVDGLTLNFTEAGFVDGALVMTVETSVPILLDQASTPISLRYSVVTADGDAVDLAQLVQTFALIGPTLQHIRDGLERSRPSSPPDTGQPEAEDRPA
jgi:hypothetical protein